MYNEYTRRQRPVVDLSTFKMPLHAVDNAQLPPTLSRQTPHPAFSSQPHPRIPDTLRSCECACITPLAGECLSLNCLLIVVQIFCRVETQFGRWRRSDKILPITQAALDAKLLRLLSCVRSFTLSSSHSSHTSHSTPNQPLAAQSPSSPPDQC